MLLLFLAATAAVAITLAATGTIISISLSPMLVIITASCIGALIWLAWDNLFGDSTPEISQDAKISLEMQDALLNTRRLDAEVISLQVQLDAALSKVTVAELKIQEFDAATALTNAAADIALTSTAIKEANESSSKSHESLQAIILKKSV